MVATVNNNTVEVIKAFDTFIMVEIDEGINNIEITYKPQLLLICLIVTIIAIIIFIVFSLLNKKFNIADKEVVV